MTINPFYSYFRLYIFMVKG